VSFRTVLVLALALVFGGAAAFGVTMWNNQGIASTNETVPVVVAKDNCQRGHRLTAEMLTTLEWQKNRVPPGAIFKIEDAVGRAPLQTIHKGHPLNSASLAERGDGSGLAMLIPKGMRAFTILTRDLAVPVAGLIVPGNKVDVLLTVTSLEHPKTGQNHNISGSTTLLQNVEILALDQDQEAPRSNKVNVKELRSVTLLVTPEQASLLDLAQNKGLLHLSLRHPQDSQPSKIRSITMKDLPFDQLKEPPYEILPPVAAEKTKEIPPLPPVIRIRTIRGNHETETSALVPPNSKRE
jgi:pilus assembly protein CpaB